MTVRRFVDITVGSVLALGVVPALVVLAAIGLLVFRANPFFVHDRVGLAGRRFHFLKLRSMSPDAPAYATKHELRAEQIPFWGRQLRRFHIDELPQLLLVPIGRMSLVGPRPEMPFLHERFPQPFAERRVSVRPGCTGLWQVGASASGLIADAPEYDEFYLQHRSWRLDLWIVAHTITKMLGVGEPATLEQVPAWATRRGTAPEYSGGRA